MGNGYGPIWFVCQNVKARSGGRTIYRRYDKVPNSGLGPKWDQSAKMVPIWPSKFLILPSDDAERGRQSVIAVFYLDIQNVSCACL